MKVLMLNGSARPTGNTYIALLEIGEQLKQEGIDYEIVNVGGEPIRDCLGCGKCTEAGCAFGADDGVNDFIAKAREADGFVFGTPVYYAHRSGAFAFKPGAAVAVARRGGTSASFDVLNKYFGISRMPVVGATYWNLMHGAKAGEAVQDAEGLQTMRNLARNMAYLLKCQEAGRQAGVPLPETERGNRTNFIR